MLRYFALELCTASLDQCYLPEKDPRKYKGLLPPEHEVFLQMSEGLAFIHSKLMVHRSIKPENVLISNTVPVLLKWSDFGLCKQANVRGTFPLSGIKEAQYWTAPEILCLMEEQQNFKAKDTEKKHGTIKSDVFALGLVFFTFLTNGLHMFGSKNLIVTNVLRGKATNLNS